MTQLYNNPYVGPRTFTRQEGDRFFGREREARDLFSLVVSERLTLFYAQSGAGKSSLINTRLIPQLQEAGFAVLPVGRVSGELPPGVSEVDNIFTFNLMLHLDERESDPLRFAHISLTDFLAGLTSDDGEHYYFYEAEAFQSAQDSSEVEIYAEVPSVLIIDQFEEIITSHSARWPEREGFFRQLDEAMAANSLLWVVLTLREDFVAALDPYASLLTSKLRARFYMQRMGYEAALEAIKKPAEYGGRPFAPGVAESLVDNLRQVRSQVGTRGMEVSIIPVARSTSAEGTVILGEFIEPVQLQVVCYQLWENLKTQPAGEITPQELQELGNVDVALAQFYEQVIAEVISQANVSEIDLRHWFEYQLITEAGTRGTVYRGNEQTGGLANVAVDLLAGKFLIRAEVRTGGAWYELVHDRFVNPILEANLAWRLKQPLIQMAQAWATAERSDSKLLEGQALKDALASNWQGLGPLVESFLTASEAAQKAKDEAIRAEREAQRQRELEARQKLAEERAQAAAQRLEAAQQLAELQQQRVEEQVRTAARLRQRAVSLAIVGMLAIILAVIAGVFAWQAQQNATQAATRAAEALAAQQMAEANATYAISLLETQQAAQNEQAASTVVQVEATQTALAVEAAGVQAALAAQAIIAETTEVAELEPPPTDTPTVIPLSTVIPISTDNSDTSTDEPDSTETSTPTATPTATATTRSTPTPNQTETVEALQVQATQIAATQTAVAQVVACPLEIGGEFVEVWNRHKERLGCPEQASPVGGFFAEQPFERGVMFWSQLLDLYVVMIGNEREGTWEIIRQVEVNWPVDMSGPSCDIGKTPSGRIQPIRGFGGIWCARPDIRERIGFGLIPEHGVSNDLFQKFERGVILRAGNNAIYILFEDNRTYLRQ